MTFEFMCPNGDLLQGDPAQVGQRSKCPICGSEFEIPTPQPLADQPVSQPTPPQPPAHQAVPPPPPAPAVDMASHGEEIGTEFPGIRTSPRTGGPVREPPADVPDADSLELGSPWDDPNRVVRILCPKGHELETPVSMVGTDAMCPHCSAQFRLRYEDSLEYREELEKEREQREERFGRSALRWAIVTTVLVVLGLVGLILFGSMK